MMGRALLMALVVLMPGAAWAQDADETLGAAAYGENVPGEVPSGAWWTAMGDPTLETLIREGFAGNPSLSLARERIKQSRAQSGQSLAPVLPSLSFDLTGKRTNVDPEGQRDTFGGVSGVGGLNTNTDPTTTDSGSAFFNARLEADIFGKSTFNYLSSRRAAEAASNDTDAAASDLALAIAGAYYDLIAARMRGGRGKTNRGQRTASRIGAASFRACRRLGIRRAPAAPAVGRDRHAAAAGADRPGRRGKTARGSPGANPGETPAVASGVLPPPPSSPGIGEPDQLLDNRPDLRAARMRVESAKQAKRSAVGGFLPTLTLTGRAGEQVPDFDQDYSERLWEVGAVLSIPIFQGGRNLAGYRLAKAQENAARFESASLALEAVREVESAAVRDREQNAQLDANRRQFEAAETALEQSKQRYVNGLADYQAVLTALNARQQAELAMIEAHRALLVSRSQLYGALGGAWTRDLHTVGEGD
ncbi:MAG: TolC family protein [Deltaproteobacteria bacterium]|nr:TolC family protein [Deltaproteobacteria bacterium]